MKIARYSPFVRFYFALHLVALVLLVAPAYWFNVLAFIFLLHCFVAAVGLIPKSKLLGPNLTRLPATAVARGEVAITIDDGPDAEVTPAVLAILREHGVNATFFCIGEKAAANPTLCRETVAAGNDIENHGQRHRKSTSLFGPRGWKKEVGQGQTTLAAITGRRPSFFRPIAGLRNWYLDPLLRQLGLQLVSWTRRGYDTRLTDPDRVYNKLTRDLASGDILLLHDGSAARTASGTPVILEVLPRLLNELAARNLKPVTLRHACIDQECTSA
jgi:peptidoglycan-N-acetylglucosamine deacetylase